ncbi:hypothetical protein D3C81_821680 [compost metagenome]
MHAVATPSVIDHPQFFGRNAQQRLVEDRHERLRLAGGSHGVAGGLAADRGAYDQVGVGGHRMVGVDQGGDHGIDGTASEECHGVERALGLDPANVRIARGEHVVHRAVSGNCDASVFQLFQGGELPFIRSADQHIGTLKVRAADLQGLLGHTLGGERRNHIGPAVFEAGDHVGDAAGALHLETQAGTQADELQQVSGDTPEIARAIEKGHRGSGIVDGHAHDRVVL